MPKSSDISTSDRVRLQVELTEERMNAIDKIVKLTGMASRKEFFDNALAAMAWMVREVQSGRIIASVSHDHSSFKELVMPSLTPISNSNVFPEKTTS